MDTKAIMWVFLGLVLILAGITSSLKEGKQPVSQTAPQAASRQNSLTTPTTPSPADSFLRSNPRQSPSAASDTLSVQPQSSSDKKFDTGFTIDPIKGLRRKDQNEEYFK